MKREKSRFQGVCGVFAAVCVSALSSAAQDGRLWFGADHYNSDSYHWSDARLWDSFSIARDGGVATFGGPAFKGFDQNVEGLTLRGLDFASCEASCFFGSFGDYLSGKDITMTGDAFLSSDNIRPVANAVYNGSRQPQKLALTLKGTGENTLTRRGLGTINFAKPVQGFGMLRIVDGLSFAATATEGKVFTADETTLGIAGGAAEVRTTGDVALGGALKAGENAGLLAVNAGTLTAPSLEIDAVGAMVVSNGAGKVKFAASPADAKGRVDPRVVMRDYAEVGAPFRFAKYDDENGLQPIEPADSLVRDIAEAGEDDIALATSETAETNVVFETSKRVKALMVDNRVNLSISNGVTLAVGDGTNPAGVIFSEKTYSKNYTSFSGGGTLDFGTSPGLIWKGIPTDNTGSGRGLKVMTRIMGSAGLTFASRSTYAGNSYCLVQLFKGCCGWTGPTRIYNGRLWLSDTTNVLPPGGDVYIVGNRSPYSSQLFVGGATFDQHFHFSGYGAGGYNSSGTDGSGALISCGNLTFNGPTTLDDDALFTCIYDWATLTFNGVIDGPGCLEIGGPCAYRLNAANTFTGGLKVGSIGGSPTVTAASLAALGDGPVSVTAGKLVFAADLKDETFTNAISVTTANAVPLERSSVVFKGPTSFAATQIDTDIATPACSSIGAGDSLDLGVVNWVNSAGTGEVYAATGSATLKLGGATDFIFNGVLRDGAAGKLGLVKKGADTLTLVGPKTHTGPTTVEEGTLKLEGDVLSSPSIAYWLDASRPETIDVGEDGHVTAWRSVVGDYAFKAGTYKGKNGSETYPTPTYARTTKINGLDVVTFNNLETDAHEALAGEKNATQRSVFIVTRVNKTCHPFGGIFGRMNADNGLRINGAGGGTGSGSWNHTVSTYKYNSDGILYKDGVKGVGNTGFKYGDVQIVTQFHAYDRTASPGSYATFRPSLGLYSGYCGAGDGSYYRAVGADICEVIAYDRVLTTAERQRVENYLSMKWKGKTCHANPEKYELLSPKTALTLRAGTMLDLNGGDLTVASLSGEGTITNSSATAATLRVTGESAFAGRIAGGVTLKTGASANLKVAVDSSSTLAAGGGTTALAAYAENIPADSLGYWLDAGVASTIVTNAAGEVTRWNSRATSTAAGFYYEALGKTSARPHAYEQTGLNGKPAVHFTDTTQILKSDAALHTRTVFLVGKLDGNQIDMGAPWGLWNSDVEYRFSGATSVGRITSLALITPTFAGDTLHINGINHPLNKMTQTADLGTDVYLLAFRLSDCHTDLDTKFYKAHGLNRNLADRGTVQWVGEAICYERALTDAEFASVENYLLKKWFASGTGPFPAVEPVLSDGAGLSLGSGGTLSGDLTLNGPFLVDAENKAEMPAVTLSGNLTFGPLASAVLSNYRALTHDKSRPALVVNGTVVGGFSSVLGLLPHWSFDRAGNTWSINHIPGTILLLK